MGYSDKVNYKSTIVIEEHIDALKKERKINGLDDSSTILDIEDLLQWLMMEIEDYRTEISQNECRIKHLEQRLKELT